MEPVHLMKKKCTDATDTTCVESLKLTGATCTITDGTLSFDSGDN
jgi:hypothetical protein